MSNVGTYIIRHPATGIFYIGSTKSYSHRRAQHLYLLRNNQHYSPLLQQAWNQSPEVVWEYTPHDSREEAYSHEQTLIAQNFSNMLMANGSLNVKGQSYLSEESKDKIRKAKLGHVQSEETIRKRFASRKGYTHSEETRQRISESQKGKVISEEARQKMSVAKIGTKASAETRALLSALRTGTVLTDDWKTKIGEANGTKIKVNGVIYVSASEAARELGVSCATVLARARNPKAKWSGWEIIHK